jgi:hypothetical protein
MIENVFITHVISASIQRCQSYNLPRLIVLQWLVAMARNEEHPSPKPLEAPAGGKQELNAWTTKAGK